MINILRFRSSKESRFKLLHEEFKHVDCFIYDAVSWIHIDATHSRLHLKSYRADAFDAEQLVEDSYCTHALMQDIDEKYARKNFKLRLLNLFSCVTIAKFVSNVDNSFVVTPFQLYKHLSKQKNVEVLK